MLPPRRHVTLTSMSHNCVSMVLKYVAAKRVLVAVVVVIVEAESIRIEQLLIATLSRAITRPPNVVQCFEGA